MKTLYYFPLEQYPERYTALMSCRDGWAESWFKRFGVRFVRVEGQQTAKTIGTGCVLDAAGRCAYSMSQLQTFIQIWLPQVQDGDVVYLEDFMHFGAESLFYIRQMTGKKFTIGCFCHAQSVDDTDFTYLMRDWLRPIEVGFGKQYDHIFTCSPILKRLLVTAGIGDDDSVHVTGLPFNSECLCRQLHDMGMKPSLVKDDFVLFSSRFDDEKDPMFFLSLVERCPDIQFKLVSAYTSRPVSQNPAVMERLNGLLARGGNLQLVNTANKLDYYETLAKAKVQFNCAHQDWVSWTLVEASLFQCFPLYPRWKDFPTELRDSPEFLYRKGDLDDCESQLRCLMERKDAPDVSFVYKKHDGSWRQYLAHMGLI